MKLTDVPADTSAHSIEEVRARLLACVDDLDRLELHHPAALISMAIDQLDQRSGDRGSFC